MRLCFFLSLQTLTNVPWEAKLPLLEPVGPPHWLSGNESTRKARATGDDSSIPGLGRSPGEGHGNPLQYSCLENPMDSIG